MKFVSVQFTGTPSLFNYRCDPALGTPVEGQRAVVPTKMKNDGTVTLTIATIVSVSDDNPGQSSKGILALIAPERIAAATELVIAMEANPAEYV